MAAMAPRDSGDGALERRPDVVDSGEAASSSPPVGGRRRRRWGGGGGGGLDGWSGDDLQDPAVVGVEVANDAANP